MALVGYMTGVRFGLGQNLAELYLALMPNPFIREYAVIRCGKEFTKFDPVDSNHNQDPAQKSLDNHPAFIQEPQLQTSPTSPLPMVQVCDYVLLCVDALSKCKELGHDVLPSPGPQRMDGNFFRNLKAQYYQIRPRLYVLFTFRDILYFKFVRIDHFPNGRNRILCSERQELPCGSDGRYHSTSHNPPPIQVPPIEPERMKHFFDDPTCVDLTDENLTLIPKRIKGPLPNTEPIVWGLQAVHGPSMAMILVVWLIIAGLCGLFIWVWLRIHPGDLGGAAGRQWCCRMQEGTTK
ncbi:hypothetical protein K440DRAFT_643464 [Wilcoxina mikolae CBS 423.85]|nr:hypothetical protein K440DRAFT_643464 [Wilcoxina mikolae CBS 423.85]